MKMNYLAIPGLTTRQSKWTFETIYKEVSDYYGVHFNRRTKRTRTIVNARCACTYILRMHTKLSTNEIGRLLGDYDHSTVIHWTATAHDIIRFDDIFKEDIENIINNIKLNHAHRH